MDILFFQKSHFHAAEQRSKMQKNDSAEYPARGYKLRDFPRSLHFVSSTGELRLRDQVNGCPFFWFVFFGHAKKMNISDVY